MGHIADMVPNHMGVMGADNAWWMDVLENGPASRYAHFFDIDWWPNDRDLAGRVLLPVLGIPYGSALESGEIELRFEPERGAIVAWYRAHRFPLDPQTYPMILYEVVGEGAAPESIEGLARLTDALRSIPARDVGASTARQAPAGVRAWPPRAGIARRERSATRELDRPRRRAAQSQRRPSARNPRSTGLSARQLAGGIRRNQLSPLLRHQRARSAADGASACVRDDARLRARAGGVGDDRRAARRPPRRPVQSGGLLQHNSRRSMRDAPAWRSTPQRGRCMWWRRRSSHLTNTCPRRGTYTGRLVIATPTPSTVCWSTAAHGHPSTASGARLSATRPTTSKQLRTKPGARCCAARCAAGLTVLANQALGLARGDRHSRDHTLASLRQGLAEISACFPVYRTYVSQEGVGPQDRRYIDWAVARASRRSRVH